MMRDGTPEIYVFAGMNGAYAQCDCGWRSDYQPLLGGTVFDDGERHARETGHYISARRRSRTA
jgi:hypothetical protein